MLKMKPTCEKCGATTGLMDAAFICSFECTFCATCTAGMGAICPNCSGNLVLRPTRARRPLAVGMARVRKKVFGGGS